MLGVDGEPLETIRRYDPRDRSCDKTAVFSPRIGEINYTPGAHTCSPSCPTVSDLLPLYHYAALGEEYTVRRYRKWRERMSFGDIKHGFGRQYLQREAEIRARCGEARTETRALEFRL
jgi:hypothetical protein